MPVTESVKKTICRKDKYGNCEMTFIEATAFVQHNTGYSWDIAKGLALDIRAGIDR